MAVTVTINGVDRTANVMPLSGSAWSSLEVLEALNDEPDTASMVVKGFTPLAGHAVEVVHGVTKLFGGSIVRPTQVYVGASSNVQWKLFCADWMRLMNRRLVNAFYTGTPKAILLAIVADFTSGFTTTNVAAALDVTPLSGGISFTNEPAGTAITRLMRRAGGYWYIDADRDIHAFYTDAASPPNDVTDVSTPEIESLVIHRDVTQVRTRVFVEGGGSETVLEVLAGATSMRVFDGSWYAPGGGLVQVGPQVIAYAASGLLAGPSAPTAAESRVDGRLYDGAYRYKVALIDAGQELPVSVPSNAVTITSVPDPTSAIGAADVGFSAPGSAPTIGVRTAGAGPDDGTHEYAVTFETATGETTGGPRSAAVTTGKVAAPSSPPTSTKAPGGNLSAGAYTWKVTYGDSAGGETTPSSASGSVTMDEVAAPSASWGQGQGPGGNLTPGGYHWRWTFYTAGGETVGGTVQSLTINTGNSSAQHIGMPISADPLVIGRRLYRGSVGGGTDYKLVYDIPDNTSTGSIYDTTADAARGANIPTASTANYRKADLTSIPVSGDGNVTTRRIYRTTAGGSTYKLVATIADNVTTTYTDNVADGSLGANAPSTNTAAANVVPLTAIPTGPAGTTNRKLYRTTAAAPTGQLKLVATIAGNVTTTFNDTVTDGSLGANIPTVNTAGGSLGNGTYTWRVIFTTASGESAANTEKRAGITTGGAALSSIPTSGDARVTGRKIYRTIVNGSSFFLEATIADNVTTTYASTLADGALGAALADVNTAKHGQINLTSLATGGASITARRIYRTIAGGAVYKLLATILENVTTSYLDTIADASLGAEPPAPVSELTGIPASGAGAVAYDIRQQEPVNIVAQVDDTAAQTALAAIEGGDGIHEHSLVDGRLVIATATARGTAELARFKDPIVTVTYDTHDPLTRVGKSITFNLSSPTSLVGSFVIQRVRRSAFTGLPGGVPRCAVEASSVKFSLEDLLRWARVEQGG